MIDAILFDLGDTLFHYARPKSAILVQDAIRPLYERLLQLAYRVPPFPTYVRAMKWEFIRGITVSRLRRREYQLVEGLHRVHLRLGLNIELERIREHCLKQMGPAVRRFFVAAEGVGEMLTAFRLAGYRLGIVSNTIVPREAIDTVLRDHGLLDFFPVRVYSSEVRFMKPDARIFQIALGELDAAPERTLFIGDHVVNDIKGAAGVGMKTVLAVHGERVPRTPLRPDHVIRELAELPPILNAYAK